MDMYLCYLKHFVVAYYGLLCFVVVCGGLWCVLWCFVVFCGVLWWFVVFSVTCILPLNFTSIGMLVPWLGEDGVSMSMTTSSLSSSFTSLDKLELASKLDFSWGESDFLASVTL